MPDDDDSVELNKTALDERIKSLIEHRIGALLKQFTWAVAVIVIIVPALVAVVLYAERKHHFIKNTIFINIINVHT